MSALSLPKIPPPALGILAIGLLWYLTQQRRAVAGGTGTAAAGASTRPIYGTEAALRNGAVRAYQVPPAGYLPSTNPLTTGLNAPGRLPVQRRTNPCWRRN